MDDLIYIIDLNEVRGDEVVVARDYTCNLPLRTLPPEGIFAVPEVGELVRVHSDEDNTLYYAQVTEVISTRDFRARIFWDSRSPVLRPDWSARVEPAHHVGLDESRPELVRS